MTGHESSWSRKTQRVHDRSWRATTSWGIMTYHDLLMNEMVWLHSCGGGCSWRFVVTRHIMAACSSISVESHRSKGGTTPQNRFAAVLIARQNAHPRHSMVGENNARDGNGQHWCGRRCVMCESFRTLNVYLVQWCLLRLFKRVPSWTRFSYKDYLASAYFLE